MLPATNRGVGMNIGFPDVCLTPMVPAPVPIPYPNFALTAQAVPFSPCVVVSGVNALNMASKIPITFGDDAGTAHPVFKQVGAYVMGNPIVFVDRLPAINLASLTTGNAMNNPIGAVLVPSAVNVFYTLARPARGAEGPAGDARDPAGEVAQTAASPREPARTSEGLRALGEVVSGRAAAAIAAAMLDGEVGHVRVRVVTSDVEGRFFLAARRLADEGARALVIDLRGCPGGDLDAAIAWAAGFLDAGAEIVRIEDAEGDVVVRRAALPPVHTMPLVLLVDPGTGSAAEVFAAGLKAHGRARILGRSTHGKGTVQRFLPGDGGALAYCTTARCLVPDGGDGVPLDDVGVTPDVTLPDAPAGGDAWLEAARDAARALLSQG